MNRFTEGRGGVLALLAVALINLAAAGGVLAWLLSRNTGGVLLAALLTIGLAAGGAACVPLVLILRGSKL